MKLIGSKIGLLTINTNKNKYGIVIFSQFILLTPLALGWVFSFFNAT